MSDSKALTLLRQLLRGGATESEAMYVIRELHAKGNGGFPLDPDSERELLAKAKEGQKPSLKAEVEEWVCLQPGYILSTDIYRELHLSTKQDKKNVSIIMKRLESEGKIERNGNKRGAWRVIDPEEEVIDITGEPDPVLPLKWPLQIEGLVNISPRNIIIIAGVSNAGKTTFLMNFIAMNYENFKIKYMTSEMSRGELIRMLKQYDVNFDELNKRVVWTSRGYDQWDKMHGDFVNVIDYLEVDGEAPWKMRDSIRKIHSKLKTGIAIIALQKPKGREIAFGGAGTLEKARLYLAVDYNRTTIVKAKERADRTIDPNGMYITYEIRQGHYITDKRWMRPDKEPF